MRAVMALSPIGSMGGEAAASVMRAVEIARRRAMGTRRLARALRPLSCLGLDGESPFRTAGNDGQASSVTRAALEGRQRPKKPAPSLL